MRRYVIDTCCLINYFGDVFGERRRLTRPAVSLLDRAFAGQGDVLLSIPAIAFVEVYDVRLHDAEATRRFYFDVFERVRSCGSIEIRELDSEVMRHFLAIRGALERHDRIVLACAVALNSPLITWDPKIAAYVQATGVIPGTLY